MSQHLLRFIFLVVTVVMTGCGGSGPSEDPTPFVTAIGDYLKAGNMGMAVHEVKELAVDGDSATATVSLAAADAPQVKVRWQFEFKRDGAAWRAVKHKE